ncbi:Crp/Fnr family transcriptional regulator, partial [Blautia producta]|nr:Crp/Fnr family transcriptional regulator [Blautia producta]
QDQPEPVSCEIMEEALKLAVPRKQLLALMETDARLMRFLFSSQSHKVRRLYRQLKNTTNATRGVKKMAAKLWKLARDYGKRPCH